MPEASIRTATTQDAAAIAAIYNHYIATSTATFDTVAWGSLSRWGTRCAYRHTVEISTYVAPDATGSGLGPLLSNALIAEARRTGHHAVISQIVSENGPSLKMGERLGFAEVGRLREVGRKFDRWLDIVLMELVLQDSSAEQDGGAGLVR